MSEQLSPSQLWSLLKERGNPTIEEIDAINKVTPWQETEPDWWCEMMDARRQISNTARSAS